MNCLIRPTNFKSFRLVRNFSKFTILNSTQHRVATNSSVFKYLEKEPEFIKFTSDHEWLAKFDDNSVFVGITKYAADALGDVTYVELPEVNDEFSTGDVIGSVESVKSASDIYSPVSGTVYAVNDKLISEPGLINQDPQQQGWLAHLKVAETEKFDDDKLLSLQQYENLLTEE